MALIHNFLSIFQGDTWTTTFSDTYTTLWLSDMKIYGEPFLTFINMQSQNEMICPKNYETYI